MTRQVTFRIDMESYGTGIEIMEEEKESEDREELSPAELLVVRLHQQWDASDALVLMDWCAERGLKGIVWALQRVIDMPVPDDYIRNDISRLGSMMGISADLLEFTDKNDWLRPWQHAKIIAAGCCGLEWRGGMQVLERDQDPIWRIRGYRHRGGPLNRCTRPKDHRGPHRYDPKFGEETRG